MIETSGDPQGLLLLRIGCERRLQSRIGNALHQAQAEGRCWDAKDDIVAGEFRLEVGLLDVAARRIRTSGNDEEVVHAAIRRSVWVADKADLAHRAVRGDE